MLTYNEEDFQENLQQGYCQHIQKRDSIADLLPEYALYPEREIKYFRRLHRKKYAGKCRTLNLYLCIESNNVLQ